jgi:hypothetical protein
MDAPGVVIGYPPRWVGHQPPIVQGSRGRKEAARVISSRLTAEDLRAHANARSLAEAQRAEMRKSFRRRPSPGTISLEELWCVRRSGDLPQNL